ncbi:MAG: hypothetical protein HYZ50_21280 [Deltaproteobacteria bacterium]|nr:hypothetical protein [Deltaproteobacteria bacterium]
MAATKKKAPVKKPSRWWLIPKLFMLLGIGGLIGVLATIFVMEKELDRINFFRNERKPVFEPAKPEPHTPSPTPPAASPSSRTPAQAQMAGQTAPGSAPTRAGKDAQIETEKKRQDNSAPARTSETLSHDDRKKLEDVLRTR